MTKILKAKPIVDSTLDSLTSEVNKLKSQGINPKMRIILVGENPSSLSYVKSKMKLCEEIGAEAELIQLPIDVDLKRFQQVIKETNESDEIQGAIIQLPIPKQLHEVDVNQAIIPKKDIDGFHIFNIENLYQGKNLDEALLPCTPQGVLALFDFYKIPLEGKNILIVGRSLLVGKPLSLLLNNRNATVTLAHSKTNNLKEVTKSADIIVSAAGMPRFITEKYLSDHGNQILIDVGINKVDGVLCGDMDFENIKDKCQAITPVPGGIGPLTVLSLIKNLIKSCQRLSND